VRVIEEACEVTAAAGRTILVGVPPAGERVSISSLPLHFGKVLTGSHGGQADPAADIPRYLALNRQGRLRLEEMITHRFPLEQINRAVELLRCGEAGRVIVAP